METILFEKQEARLCAQHALNMLLQGPYFTASDLAEIGLEIDNAELAAGMVEDTGVGHNVDDTGFFSVQVIATALSRAMNLTMTPLTHPDAQIYRTNPTAARGYICNLDEHWFAVRRFGTRWFELNSIKNGPMQISESHLNEFFAQLLQEGYSIFLVEGDYPDSRADDYFSTAADAGELLRRPVNVIPAPQQPADVIQLEDEEEDPELRAALEASRAQFDGEDVSLSRALEASRLNAAAQNEAEDRALQEALRASQADYEQELREAIKQSIQLSNEDEDLRRAMEMSIKEEAQKIEKQTADLLASTSEAGPSGFSYPKSGAPQSSASRVAAGSSTTAIPVPGPSSSLSKQNPARASQTADENAEMLRRQRAAFLDRLQSGKPVEQEQ